MAEHTVDPKQLFSNMFAGIIKSAFPGKDDPKPDGVNKAVIDRSNEHSFISVSDDSKNITLLGYDLPDEAESGSHANDGRYGILVYRDKANSITFTLLDEGVTTNEAQNRAMEMVENNRNNIYYTRVYVGVPWTFGGRPVFRGFVSFYVLSKSMEGSKEPVDFKELVEKAKAAIDKAYTAEAEPAEKMQFTTEPWTEPSTDLSIEELSKCVPAPIAAWAKRFADAQGLELDKADLTFPYKSVDGTVNLNAVNAILKMDDTYDLPPSVISAVSKELNGLLKKAASISRSVLFINKAASMDRGLVYGLVYEPLVKDTDGEFATAEEIETAAHNYLPAAMLNIQHDENQTLKNADSVVVESYIAPCDFTLGDDKVTKGSWVLVTKVFNEELRDQIRKGEITGYSMEGTAFRI